MYKKLSTTGWLLFACISILGCESEKERGDRIAKIAAEQFFDGFIKVKLMPVLNAIDIPFCLKKCREVVYDRATLEKTWNLVLLNTAKTFAKSHEISTITPTFEAQRIGTIDDLQTMVENPPTSAQLENLRNVLGVNHRLVLIYLSHGNDTESVIVGVRLSGSEPKVVAIYDN